MIKWQGLGSQFHEDWDKEGVAGPGAAGAEGDGSSAEPSRGGCWVHERGARRTAKLKT